MLLAKSCFRRPVHPLPCMPSAFKALKLQRFVSDSSVKDKSLYRILGVSPDATQTEIKDAYYNLTLKFHPDRNEGSPEAAVKFNEITEAYEVLGNFYMRKRYDKGMPLPTRREAPHPDVTVPHVVKYQQFFDRRNLPYQPSAYAAGGGARKFDEYHAKQFYERRKKPDMSEEREYEELCKQRKTPTLVGIIMLMCIIKYVRKDLDYYTGPLNSVEHFDWFEN